MHEQEETEQVGPTWQNIAMGCAVLLVTVGGYIIGDTLTSIRQELRDVRASLGDHSRMAARLDAIETRTADQEERLRYVEREQWKQGTH
jgi:hypothetical protein